MNEIAHLISRPWLMNERMAGILYHQYLTGRLSLADLKDKSDKKKVAQYASLKGVYIGQHVWRTMKVKHASGKFVAIIPVIGTLTKRGDLCSYGMRDYMAEIDELNDNEDISAIVLDMEGPGGTVDGTPEFGMYVKQSKKPIVTFGDCMVASADYWVASQSRFIIGNANNPTEFGSIGVLCVHEYWGKYIEENIGEIKIIRAPQSSEKALVNPLEKLSEEEEKLIIEDLRTLATSFHKTVKEGRGDRLKGSEKEWGTGRMFNNEDALKLGLIDAIGTMMDAIDKAVELTNTGADENNNDNKKQGASQRVNKSKTMNVKQVARKASSFFGLNKEKKTAAKAAAAEPAAAEEDTTPMWTAEMVFNTDGSGDGAFCLHADDDGTDRKFETKIDNNTGNEPPTDPAVTEDDNWSLVQESAEGAAEESGEAEQATTVVKLNAALKKANAEIKTLKAEIAKLGESVKQAQAEKAANEKKPAAKATTVVSGEDKQDDGKTREMSASEKEAEAYRKASSTNIFK